MIGEARFGGVYVAPIVVYAVAAMFPFAVIRWCAARAGLLERVWHPALFEVALYLVVLATLFLYF